ncbi:MAG: hypothetical protein WDN49_16185 [Acetobacteraceae bacterium]
MSYAELLAAVIKLYAGDGDEEEITALVERLRRELPHSKISDLIFHDFRGLTPEQVVDEALRREAEYAAKLTGKATDG